LVRSFQRSPQRLVRLGQGNLGGPLALHPNKLLSPFQLIEEFSVYGSEEEADDPPDAETDDDLTDEERDIHEVLTILFYVYYGFGS
jgi:hypothetical protein